MRSQVVSRESRVSRVSTWFSPGDCEWGKKLDLSLDQSARSISENV